MLADLMWQAIPKYVVAEALAATFVGVIFDLHPLAGPNEGARGRETPVEDVRQIESIPPQVREGGVINIKAVAKQDVDHSLMFDEVGSRIFCVVNQRRKDGKADVEIAHPV